MSSIEFRSKVVFVWLALVVLGALLFANQYITLPKAKAFVLSETIGASMNSTQNSAVGLVLDNWSTIFSLEDAIIGLAIFFVLGALFVFELRYRAITGFLDRAEQSTPFMLTALGLLSLMATRAYLSPGQVFMGDAETHMLRSWMVADLLRNCQAPVWSNYWYGGYPILQYYGPLYFVATALLTLLFGDIHLATKLLLWAPHFGSAFTMYFYLREVIGRPLPSLVGAAAFVLAFHRLHIILYQGDVQLSIVFFLYPLILFLIERFLRADTRPKLTLVLLSLTFAALVLNHHGYAFFGLVFAGIYTLVRVALWRQSTKEKMRALAFFALSGTCGLFMSAFLLVPFLLDTSHIRGMPATPFAILVPNYRAPLLFLKMFTWANVGDGSNVGYMGLSIGLAATLAIPFVVRNRIGPAVALLVAGTASVFMVKDLVQYNVKNVSFFMIHLCALAGWAPVSLEASRSSLVVRLANRWGERFPAKITLALLALFAFDLGPTTVQSVYRDDYEFKEVMYEKARAAAGSGKLIERQVLKYVAGGDPGEYFDPNKLGIPSAYTAVHSPLGFFHEGAGKSFAYNVEITKQLHRDLNQGHISELTVHGLYLMGVDAIIFRDKYRYFTPQLEPSTHFVVENEVLRFPDTRPLVLSTRVLTTTELEGYPESNIIEARHYFDPETFDYSGRHFRELVVPLIEHMAIDLEHGIADVLIAHEPVPPIPQSDEKNLQVDITSFAVDARTVKVGYRSNHDAVGRLAYTYFPYLEVTVDAEPAEFFRSAMNYVLVPLPAGDHVVAVRGVASPLRKQTFLFSMIVGVLVLVIPGSVLSIFARPRRLEVPVER